MDHFFEQMYNYWTFGPNLPWPLFIFGMSVLLAAVVLKFNILKELLKGFHSTVAKIPAVHQPQIISHAETKHMTNPPYRFERDSTIWESKSVDFGTWQGIRFGFGLGIGLFLSVVFLSFVGLWFFDGLMHSVLSSLPVFH